MITEVNAKICIFVEKLMKYTFCAHDCIDMYACTMYVCVKQAKHLDIIWRKEYEFGV